MTVGRSCLPNLVGDGTVENSWGANWIPRLFYKEIGSRIAFGIYQEKARAGANTESPAKYLRVKYIHEILTHRRTVFTWEYNELFIQRVLQYSEDKKGDELHYRVLGLNNYSTEYDMEKAYRSLALKFHSDKNQHSQVSDVLRMIKEAK